MAGGRRKSVAPGGDAKAGGRRKSVMATTPQEIGAETLSSGGSKVGESMWARMPPKHAEVYDKVTVVEVSAGTKVKVKMADGTTEEYTITDLLPCNNESDLDDVCTRSRTPRRRHAVPPTPRRPRHATHAVSSRRRRAAA